MIKAVLVIPFVLVTLLLNVFVSVIPYYIMRMLFLKNIAEKWLTLNAVVSSNFILFIMGAKVEVSGGTDGLRQVIKQNVPVCYVSNHTSLLDIPAAIGPLKLKMGFIAKKELKAIPFLNLIGWSLHSIFIDRVNLHNSVVAIKKGIGYIKNGYPMLIFPEGTRSKTGHVNSFKHGSFRLASESNAVIVPLVIKGTRALCEERKKFFTRKKVSVKVLSPVKTEGLDRDGLFNTVQILEKEVSEIYEQL